MLLPQRGLDSFVEYDYISPSVKKGLRRTFRNHTQALERALAIELELEETQWRGERCRRKWGRGAGLCIS